MTVPASIPMMLATGGKTVEARELNTEISGVAA